MNTIVSEQEKNYRKWNKILLYFYNEGELTSENRDFLDSLLSSDNIKKYINEDNHDISEEEAKENLSRLFSYIRYKYENRDDYPEHFLPIEKEMLKKVRSNYKDMCTRWGKNVEEYTVKNYERKKAHLFLWTVFENMGPMLLKDAESRVCYKKYQTYGEGEYYRESPVLDFYVENIKRGKLYKRTPKDLKNKSEFCYDKEGRLILHKWHAEGERLFFYEILIYTETQILHVQYTPFFEGEEGYLSKISLQTYENDLIMAFEMSYHHPINIWEEHPKPIWEFIQETYEYENEHLNVSWSFANRRGFEQGALREKYIYLKDNENLIYGYKKKLYYGDGEFNEAQQYCESRIVTLSKEEYDKRNNQITPISDKKRRDTGMDAVRWHRPNYFREK